MAFTPWEFIRGALITYGLFLALMCFLSFGVGLIYAIPFGLVTLLTVGAPLALLAGTLLRGVRHSWIHMFTHTLVGLISGCAGVFLFALWNVLFNGVDVASFFSDSWSWPMYLVYAIITGPCAFFGWLITWRSWVAADTRYYWITKQGAESKFSSSDDAASA
ncbi:MAG TPA: hypothetical protein VNT53_10135 [Pseudolysinimonas sp.]|nr:hypothetical protein [Pseudolysinimonas sp.]